MRASEATCALLVLAPAALARAQDDDTSMSQKEIEALRERLPEYLVSVEFRSPRWLAEERDRERTLGLLEEQGLVLACVDAPAVSGLPRLMTVTNPELFIVRFHGRADDTWSSGAPTAAERFRYLYSREELQELAQPVREHAVEARESHLLMNNCYRDYAVESAAELRDLVAQRLNA